MAITINSLTPVSPVISAGQSVTFFVSASDSGGATLFYEWQFSADGGQTYTGAGLTNNTSSTYQTSNLTQSQSGLYFRVVVTNGVETVFSNEVPSIGDRVVLVTAAPIILVSLDETVDDYPVSETIQVGQTFDFTVTASLQNVNVQTQTNVTNILIRWQESTDDGATWTNISAGGDFAISTSVQPLTASSPTVYYRRSTLTVSNSTFSRNLNQYRAVVTYPNAINTPLNLAPIILYVSPIITLYRQPGQSPDTQQTQCFKTSIPNSGQVKVQVGALTSAGTSLNYLWEMTFDNGNTWYTANDSNASYAWRLKSGTTHTTDVLEIERLIFYNTVGFRCVVSGTAGEETVTSSVHYVYMTDVQVPVTLLPSIDIIEDRYGNVANRDLFSDPVQNARITGDLIRGRNTGLNGDVTLTFEKRNPGSSIWSTVGTVVSDLASTILEQYTQFPGNDSNILLSQEYVTPPLRRDTDNQSKYRLKIESSALFTRSGTTKTLIPYYSSELTLNVYRTVYITNQPTNATAFVNASTAFSVSAEPSSGSASEITYQWQYNTTLSATGWVNVPTGGIYTGTTTNLLQITSVPLTVTHPFFRCILSIPGQLSSVTSSVATLTRRRDFFVEISNLNDLFVDQYSNVVFTINATSLSAQTVSYQWQRSTNYNPSTRTGTWSNISGQTTNTLTLLSVQLSDAAYYRCRITSFGGEVAFTNIARLSVFELIVSVIKNTPVSQTLLEGVSGEVTFECQGLATNGSPVNYQWEIQPSGGSFANIGPGHLSSSDTTRFYSPADFSRSQSGSRIRCALTAAGIPTTSYTNQTIITVNRRFTYFADTASKNVAIGSSLFLDINPTWTGGTPTFQWQQSIDSGVTWTNISGETNTVLIINNITSAFDNRQYRCMVTLADCNQHAYTRNNTLSIVSATATTPTVPVTIRAVASAREPVYYSLETQKTGAAIGTVIAVPKPAGYVNNTSATTDDISQWQVAISGSLATSNTTSLVSSGATYDANKPDWATSYASPRWLLDSDRFKGYIEMRGQYLLAREFPELARMFGTTYGGVITGIYPRYNANDYFRMPNTYAKKLLGTGNVNNNSGSVSVIPLYNPDGTSGGDKNVPGSMGGVYNYVQSAQLPPGSSGISGQPDGTADGTVNAATYTIGSYRTAGFESVEGFVQPNFSGTLTYTLPASNDQFTRNPVHSHSAVSMGGTDGYRAKRTACRGLNAPLNGFGSGAFFGITAAAGEILEGPYGVGNPGQVHNHVNTGLNGSFDMSREGGMIISDTTLRMNLQSRQLFDNSLRFFLRNNEAIPLNAPYYRLKYLIKAY